MTRSARPILPCLALGLIFLVQGGLASPQAQAAPPALGRVLGLASPRLNGLDVAALQARLLDLGYAEVGSADGWFGPKTADAVGRFRHRNGPSEGRTVDGEVWAILFDSELSLVTGEVPKVLPSTVLACDGFLLGGLGPGGAWLGPVAQAKALDGQALDLAFRLPEEAWSKGRAEVVWAPQDGSYSAGPALARPDGAYFGLASKAPFEVEPRKPSPRSSLPAKAAAALAAWLLERDIRLPGPSEAYLGLDLDGRGQEDFIARIEDLSYEGGGRACSLVLLVRQGGGAAGAWKVLLLGGDLGQAPAAKGAGEPEQILPLRSWTLRAALDVDGDGSLELILATQELDGAGVYLRKVQGQDVITLAENGGGS